jgi:hypothetical protein
MGLRPNDAIAEAVVNLKVAPLVVLPMRARSFHRRACSTGHGARTSAS